MVEGINAIVKVLVSVMALFFIISAFKEFAFGSGFKGILKLTGKFILIIFLMGVTQDLIGVGAGLGGDLSKLYEAFK